MHSDRVGRVLDRIAHLRGKVFQEFCGVLLSLEVPAFQAVNGAGGDRGNDGFLLAGDTVYQAYAPDRPLAAKLRTKIDDSIAKAVRLRNSAFPLLQRLVVLTPFDLTHDAHLHLQVAAADVGVLAESWGETRLTALLSKYPMARSAFPEFLVPDLVGELRGLREALGQSRGHVDPVEEAFGPDWHPHIFVLQRTPDELRGELQADEWFRVRIYSDALAHDSFEPDEEDAFLAAVAEVFWEDASATLESPSDDRVLVEHRDRDLRFHRRWGWWTDGVLGMAATMRDLTRPNTYSVADMALDILRTFSLLGQIAGNGSARVVVDIDPFRLAPAWDLSNLRGRGRPDAQIPGVISPGAASNARRTSMRLEHSSNIASITANSALLAGEIVVRAARKLHASRVRLDDVVSSLPRLQEISWGLRDQ
ncbi:MAG TPA: hypothetical protein VG734_01765 [Lacunisphaera sp.]|nr:hypothetical protein [Lacunisphaera sp.]